jgi:bis(5'-nucleosidyl)-tetraphosphatase
VSRMNQEKSCGAVIYIIENFIHYYLLIQYQLNHHYWGFVKGHVEAFETERETAIREIKEEVNLEDLQFYPDFRYTHQYQSNPFTNKEVVFFLAKSSTRQVTLNPEEVRDSLWLPYRKAMDRLSYPNDQLLLHDVNERLLQPYPC